MAAEHVVSHARREVAIRKDHFKVLYGAHLESAVDRGATFGSFLLASSEESLQGFGEPRVPLQVI